MDCNRVKLGELITVAKTVRCGGNQYPILSMTMHDGLVFQDEKFKKVIASKDTSDYKVVFRNQLVISFPIDEGVLAAQRIVDAGIVSPAYGIWDINSNLVIPEFLELSLRCNRAIAYYKANLRGSTARRRSLPTPTLLEFEVPLPSIEMQRCVLDLIHKAKQIIVERNTELAKLDELIKARFVEMFGDPEINPKGWKKEPLKEHAVVMVGYPFPSEGYTSEGIDIVGGYNLMQGYIQWDDSKYWPNTDGYEKYLLQANDIVMAMDRPWVNGGFKIARVDATHLPALLIQRTACIRGKDLEQEFLHFLLDTQRFAEHCNITGTLVPHISNKDIYSFPVVVPPLEEQRRFTAFVAQVDKSIVAVQKAFDAAQLLFDSLMQKYFG